MVKPRFRSVPKGDDRLGKEAVELAASAGLVLDDWQQDVLVGGLMMKGERWASFEVGLTVARQNGKGGILEARELAALFLLEERLTIHSAHMVDTAMEAWMRLRALIEDTPELHKQVRAYPAATGREGITLKNGCRVRFASRTKSGRRGFSCDCLIYDEAMFLPEFAHGATLPVLSARPNPQVWYTGSAVDQTVHENGVVFARVRERGIEGDKKLAYFEWSVGAAHPDQVSDERARDEELQRLANPADRISLEYVAQEQRALDARSFAVERLSVGDWPATVQTSGSIIDFELWASLEDQASSVLDPVCFALDKSPDGKVSIAAAGARADGLLHLEVVENKAGTRWVAERMAELVEKHEPIAVCADAYGPVASLVTELQQAGVEVKELTAGEHAQACSSLVDAVVEKRLRHRGGPLMASAIKGAKTRPLADAWVWSRKNSTVDISPLVAVTLALYGHVTVEAGTEPMVAYG